ncbi:MAG: hypothetical protein HQM08_11380 [Candidatus Riflebacteria bacterium]|nr:hypothetical protein [Candidatus Riflebacteria bacterium]
MKLNSVLNLGILVIFLAGSLFAAGCDNNSAPKSNSGPAEKVGAALDKAVQKTGNAANKATEKAGEVLEKVGAAVEKTGANMQTPPAKP